MISHDRTLDSIWQTYLTTKACLKVTDSVRRRREVVHLQKTDFITLTEEDAVRLMKSCRRELEDFVILSLWAAFERLLIEYVQEKGIALTTVEPRLIGNRLYDRFESAVEHWNFEDILELLKDVVHPSRLGDAKNIKKYRDYIAHRNPKCCVS